ALDLCSQSRFEEFIREDFSKLDREKRQQFYRMSVTPHYGKDRYVSFLVWVHDNMPIFQHSRFTWQWKDIQNAAEEKGIESPGCVKEWASQHGLTGNIKLGSL